MTYTKPIYKRVLVKLSGEALMGESQQAVDPNTLLGFAQQIAELVHAGVEVGLVIGGGNIFRGGVLAKTGMDRVVGDYMGMLATVMNALALQEALQRKMAISCKVMSALYIEKVCEPYDYTRAQEYLSQKQVIIFSAGTGNPYFTTDSAASLRAIEIKADILLKATKVDGVYSADPKKDSHAERYSHLNFDRAINDKLAVMDTTALALCRDNNMPLIVFNIFNENHLKRIIFGETELGTKVSI